MLRIAGRIRASLLIVALMAAACGDDDERTDAATGAGPDASTRSPAPPESCTVFNELRPKTGFPLVIKLVPEVAAPDCVDDRCRALYRGDGRLFPRAVGGSATNDVWLVGSSGELAHFDGKIWSNAPSIASALCATQCFDEECITPRCGLVTLADDDVWISGKDESGEDHVVRYDGSSWNAAPLPEPGLRDLTVWPVEHGGMWLTAFAGPSTAAPHAVAYRWDGAAWSPRMGGPFDQFERIEDLSGAAQDEVWVVGASAVSSSLVMRWSGNAWEQPTQPKDKYVTTVTAFGPSDVWLGGDTVLRLDGNTWKSVDQSGGVFGTSKADLWAWNVDAQAHWDGKRWQSRPFPGYVGNPEGPINETPVHAVIGDQIWVVDLAGSVRKFADDRWQFVGCTP